MGQFEIPILINAQLGYGLPRFNPQNGNVSVRERSLDFANIDPGVPNRACPVLAQQSTVSTADRRLLMRLRVVWRCPRLLTVCDGGKQEKQDDTECRHVVP